MKGETFHCVGVVGDKFPEMVRQQMAQFIRSLGAGIRYEIEVREYRDKRSIAQNRTHWGKLVTPLAEHLGYDKHEIEDLHESLLCLFAGTHADKLTGRAVPNERSSSMNTARFSEFMQWTVRFAAMEHDCILELPDEYRERVAKTEAA